MLVALYYLLHEAYQRTFGVDAAPEYLYNELREPIPNVTAFPQNPGQLLPSHDGWVYSPEWLAPRPMTSDRNRLFVRFGRHRELLMLVIEMADLSEIEAGIRERVNDHALQNRVLALLAHAIREARNDQKQAQAQLEQQAANLLRAKCNTSMARLAHQTAARGCQLCAVRLHWLQMWHKIEKARFSRVRREKKGRAQSQHFDRLIKPQDLYDASVAIQEYLESHQMARSFDFFQLLGTWYAVTLWQCGATWKDLLAIRRRNHRSAPDPRLPAGVRAHKSWAEIAEAKYRRATVLEKNLIPGSNLSD
jgi:hypothetical protein